MPFQWDARALRSYAENQVALTESFKMADLDKDGVVNGSDAVRFFRQSGLPDEALSRAWKGSSDGKPSLGLGGFRQALLLIADELDNENSVKPKVTGNPFLDGPSGAAPMPDRKPPPVPHTSATPPPVSRPEPSATSSHDGGMFTGMFSKGDKKDKNAKEEIEHPEVEQPVKMRGDGGAQGAWEHSRSASGGAFPGGSSATPNFEWKGSPEASPELSSSEKNPSKGFVGKMLHKYQEKKVEAKINKHCGEKEPSEVIVDSLRKMHFLYLAGYKYEHNKCASELAKMMLNNKQVTLSHMSRISSVLKEGARSCGGHTDNVFVKGAQAAKVLGSGVKSHPDRDKLAGDLLWSFISLLRLEAKFPLEPTLAACVNQFIQTTDQVQSGNSKAAKSLFLFADKLLEKATKAEERRKRDLVDGERKMLKSKADESKRLEKLRQSDQY